MANLGIDGLVSGFKTSEVVGKLMEIEKKPLTMLEDKKTGINSKSEAWREVNSRLNALEDAAYALQSLEMFRGRTATVSNSNAFSVTSSNGATLAKYNITVQQLAKSQSLTSDAKATSDTALNLAGTIQINGKDVTIEATDSLTKIAERINQTAGVNVTASVVKVDASNYKLVMNSKDTGLANQMTFTDAGSGDGVLTALGILKTDGTVKNETQAAKDAIVQINGLTVQRSTNTIEDAIPNVTLTLKKEGESADLSVDVDKEKIVTAVKTFVEKYNAVMEYVNKNTSYSYDVNTKKGSSGPLFGDSTLMNIQAGLQKLLLNQVSGVPEAVGLLSLVGIKGKSGIEGAKSAQLEFDEATFRAKLDSNFNDIAKLFGSTDQNGIFKKMYDSLFRITGVEGMVATKTKTLNKEIDDINKQITAMEDRLDAKEQAYYKKFQAMELALSKLNNQSNWMASQLANLSKE